MTGNPTHSPYLSRPLALSTARPSTRSTWANALLLALILLSLPNAIKNHHGQSILPHIGIITDIGYLLCFGLMLLFVIAPRLKEQLTHRRIAKTSTTTNATPKALSSQQMQMSQKSQGSLKTLAMQKVQRTEEEGVRHGGKAAQATQEVQGSLETLRVRGLGEEAKNNKGKTKYSAAKDITSTVITGAKLSLIEQKLPWLFLMGNAFVLIALASSLYAPEPSYSAAQALRFGLVFNTLYFCMQAIENPSHTLHTIAYLFLGFTLIACLYSVLLIHLGSNTWVAGMRINSLQIGPIQLPQPLYGKRASSWLGNPNLLGAFIAYAIFTLYYHAYRHRSTYQLIATAAALSLLLYTLWLTASRASTLSALVGSIVFWLLLIEKRKPRLRQPSLIAAGTAVLTVVFLFFYDKQILLHALNQLLDRNSSMLSGREQAWWLLIDSIRNHPLLGTGYQSAQNHLLKPGGFHNPYGSHNIYLGVWAELGLTGLIALMAFLLTPLIKLVKNIGQITAQHLPSTLLCAAVGSAFIFHEFFEDNLDPHSALLLYPLVCLVGVEEINASARFV